LTEPIINTLLLASFPNIFLRVGNELTGSSELWRIVLSSNLVHFCVAVKVCHTQREANILRYSAASVPAIHGDANIGIYTHLCIDFVFICTQTKNHFAFGLNTQ
jgi:hypothetical protein